MAIIPGAQWRAGDSCPWRLQRGKILHVCDHGGGDHRIHVVGHPIEISWREDDRGAFSVASIPEQVSQMAIRLGPIDLCDNRQCPNKVGEGTMTVTTVFTTPFGGKRDVTLLLCAPCAEYLSLVVRQ